MKKVESASKSKQRALPVFQNVSAFLQLPDAPLNHDSLGASGSTIDVAAVEGMTRLGRAIKHGIKEPLLKATH